MAPPALVNLDNYSDVSFRDSVIRHHNQVASSNNIIQKLYHHVTGNTANLSAADIVSVDGQNQGQWDLMLSTSARRLNANTITTANTSALAANAIISVRQATTTFRSANVIMGNLTVLGTLTSSANGASITEVGTLTSLNVSGQTSSNTLNVSGASTFDGTAFRRFRRTLGTAINSFSEICEIDIPSSTYTVELDITDTNTIKKYAFVVHRTANTNGAFQRLLPLSATDNSGDIHVEMSLATLANSDARFRLVRTGNGTTGEVDCHFKICHESSNALNFIPLTGTGTVTPATAIYETTALTQVGGQVGINTSNPSVPLDVVGAANVSGNLTAGLLIGPLATGAQPNITSVGTLSALTVAGGQITGTLATAAQPNITSLGTLSSLNVTGNLAIDTNTLTVNSAANRVGIATTTPLHPLDVTGDINSSGNLRIAGTSVLSATALGSGVLTSSLTSVGTLGSLAVTNTVSAGNMTVTDGITADSAFISNTTYRTFTRTLDSTLNAFSQICDMTGSNAYSFDLTVAQTVMGNSISKLHTGVMQFNATGGVWRRLLPISSSGPSSARNWAVDINVLNSVAQLRLVRTDATGNGSPASLACTLSICNAHLPVTLTSNVAVGFDATTTGFFESAQITQVDGRVGVGIETPAALLHVAGDIVGTGNLRISNGPILLDSVTRHVFTRTIPTGNTAPILGQGVGICTLSNSTNGAAFSAQITVVQAEDQFNSFSKQYFIPAGYNSTQGQFRRLLPLYTSSVEDELASNDVGIDISSGPTTTQLRLVRTSLKLVSGNTDTANVISSGFQITMDLCESKTAPMSMTIDTGSYFSTIPPEDLLTSMFQGSLLTHRHYRNRGNVGGVLGIGTDVPDPSFLVHANGSMKCTSLLAENRLVALGTGVLLGTGGAMSFSDKWRLFYNDSEDALVIQRNTGNVANPVWVQSGVLAQM